ncbi:SRPBCC family protein [Bdellovibrio bacteriovorus]|uniref:SRPBCC family protein n=1 Tax=Bdellovibrio bacteriovorus TaxID=959 RepID=UPI0035A65231
MEKEIVSSKESQRVNTLPDDIYTEEAITIKASAQELYNFWRDVTHFTLFTDQLESVVVTSETKSHWVWKALKGKKTIEWDCEIVQEVPFSLIAWKSTGATEDLHHSGRVEFLELPYGRGTQVKVKLAYDLPGGKITELFEKLLGESPGRNLRLNLFKLRALFEAREIPTVEGQSAGNNREHETKTALH